MSQRPDDQRNLLIAVALSMAVMLGWQFFYAGPQIKAQQEKAQREKAAQQAATKAGEPAETTPAPAAPGAVVGQSAQPAQTISGVPTGTRDEALAKSTRVPIETGARNGVEVEVRAGLEEGDEVIVHPSDRVTDGVAVVRREI